ncbi:TPA: restriction endonuclease subunit S [Escherichia coli]|uniref:restriction endonuclease subunit S n=3 Tax=Escherichia coli TaxID=562 RepID=UPI000214CD38|nr:restriction endonuclease subunit S [Escherichia coli]AKK51291.1 restriction modification system, type I [Escherichia coli PCN033]KWV17713.1 hypothetical protein AWH70_24200 [Escherichia coli]MDZ9370666.1 restriction endonuclease subunit S [Escherichia coli]MEA0123241.1 restriction endonuclease subunit S [Escherichia coli]MEA0197049.1 restriction endonuclease subunit S [Escherichia coli]
MNNKRNVTFGDLAEQVMVRISPTSDDAKHFIGLEHLKSGYFYVHDWGADVELKTQAFKVKCGEIIFSRRNTYLKRVSVSPINGICSADAMVIKSRKNNYLLDGYLPHLMQSTSFMEKVIANSAGSLSSRIKWSDLNKLEVNIPSIEQQYSSLIIFDSLAKKELLYLSALKAAKRLLYAIGLRTFDNYFDSRENKCVPLPVGWTFGSIKDVLIDSPEGGYSPVETAVGTGYYVLNLNSLSKSGFRETTLKNITEDHFLKGKTCNDGDLLISRSNTAELVGLVGKYKGSTGNGNTIFPDTMWRLAVDEKFIKKEFLMYYLMSPYGRRAIQGIAAGTSGSMKKINKDNFLKIQIPIPPFDIQASIINTFKCSYENIYRHNESLGKIIQLRQAMIDKEI